MVELKLDSDWYKPCPRGDVVTFIPLPAPRVWYVQMLREAYLRIMGRPFPQPAPPMVTVNDCRELWEMTPVGSWDTLFFRLQKGPCFIHRWMQRFCLGIKWRRTANPA